MTQERPSIHEIIPSEQGGSHARLGFSYQDYWAALFLLRMAATGQPIEVWLETHDDIVLIHPPGVGPEVEFVQVKHNQPGSPWSISQLVSGGDKSVLAKSLFRDEAKQSSGFRMATSRDTNAELAPLRLPRGHSARADAIPTLLNHPKLKTFDYKSKNGNGVDYWLEQCAWDVAPDIATLESACIRLIHEASHAFDWNPFPDQAMELLEKVVGYAKRRADLVNQWELKKVKRTDFMDWLEQQILNKKTANGGYDRLREKLKDAGCPPDLISNAEQLKRRYLRDQLESKYAKPAEHDTLSYTVMDELAKLRARQVSGEYELSAIELHNRSLQLAESVFKPHGLPSSLASGCVYEITSRCLMAFTTKS